jgi:putative transposase
MSRKGNPWDNAACESFMKTLKCEEVHRDEYWDLSEARSEIREFPKKVYNEKRLHSALAYFAADGIRNTAREAAARELSV